MAESNNTLRAIEAQIKALDSIPEIGWRGRLSFCRRQLEHALVNAGPEAIRPAAAELAEELSDIADNVSDEAYEVIEELRDTLDEFSSALESRRFTHHLGVGLFWTGIGAVVATVIAVMAA